MNETYAWMIIAGLALLAVFVLSIQFVYRTVVRAEEEEQEEEELHRQQVIDEDEKERHRAAEDSDEQPLLQEA